MLKIMDPILPILSIRGCWTNMLGTLGSRYRFLHILPGTVCKCRHAKTKTTQLSSNTPGQDHRTLSAEGPDTQSFRTQAPKARIIMVFTP